MFTDSKSLTEKIRDLNCKEDSKSSTCIVDRQLYDYISTIHLKGLFKSIKVYFDQLIAFSRGIGDNRQVRK